MTFKRLSTTVLLGGALLGLCGQQSVRAYENNNQIDQMTSVANHLAITVNNTLRSDLTALDIVVSLPKRFEEAKLLTVELHQLNGDIVNTLSYTMPAGGRQFTCWFGLNGQREGSYYVTASFTDKDETYSGYSEAIAYQMNETSSSNTTDTSRADQEVPKKLSQEVTKAETTSSFHQVPSSTENQEPIEKQQELESTTLPSSIENKDNAKEKIAKPIKLKTNSQQSRISLADRVAKGPQTTSISKIFQGILIVTSIIVVSGTTYWVFKKR